MYHLAAAIGTGKIAPANARKLVFAYDYLGRRVEKQVYGGWDGTGYSATALTDRKFVYNGWNLVAEYDVLAANALKRSYTWGLDLTGSFAAAGGVGALVELTDHTANKSYYPAYDQNGNVVALVNDGGSLAAGYEYSAFGEPMRADVLDATVADNPWRYSTKYTDVETGLVYYGYRYYTPNLGRFVNRDPIQETGGLNLYGFCANNPVSRWDVLGLDWNDEAIQFPKFPVEDHRFDPIADYNDQQLINQVNATIGQWVNSNLAGAQIPLPPITTGTGNSNGNKTAPNNADPRKDWTKKLTKEQRRGLCQRFLNPKNDIYAPMKGVQESPILAPKYEGWVREYAAAVFQTSGGLGGYAESGPGIPGLPLPDGGYQIDGYSGPLGDIGLPTPRVNLPPVATSVINLHSHPRNPYNGAQPPSVGDRANFQPGTFFYQADRNLIGSGVFDGNSQMFYWMDGKSAEYPGLSFKEMSDALGCNEFIKE